MALPTIGSGYNSLIGTRLSSVDNKTAEYYNTKTGQGFSDPNALSSFVNQNFSGVTTSGANIFSTLSGGYTAPVLKPTQITPTTNLSIPKPTTETSLNKADASVAGAITSGNNIQSYLDKLTPPASSTPESTAAKALTDRLTELYGKDTGKASALSAAEQSAGLPAMQKQLQDITNSINVKNAEYEKLNTDIAGNPIPLGLIRGEQAQVRLQQASEINLLSARAQAMQGNISLAQETAAKAVDLKYAAIEDEIKAKERQLQVIQPLLSAEERKIADAQQLSLDEQRQSILDQKNAQITNINLALQNSISTRYFNRNGEFVRAADGFAFPDETSFFKDAGVSNFQEAYDKGLVTDLKAGTTGTQTPDEKEYNLAKSQGYTGTFLDWQRTNANLKNTSTVNTNSTLIKEYNFAVSQGFKGSFLEYQSAAAAAKSDNTPLF